MHEASYRVDGPLLAPGPPSVGGREARLGIAALLKLADAVEAALGEESVPPTAPGSAAEDNFIQVTSVDTARGNPTGSSRSVDPPLAPGASRRGRKRGGKR